MGLDAAYILPSPTQILAKLWELRDVLFTVHLPATMLVTAIGLGISLVLGLALAVVMDESDLVRKMCIRDRSRPPWATRARGNSPGHSRM